MISTNTLFTTNGVLTRRKAGFPDCLVTSKVRNNDGFLVKMRGNYSKLVQHFTNTYKLNNKYMNFIYLNCGMRKINAENLITVTYATYAVVQRKPEKIQLCLPDTNPDHCDTSAAL